MGNKKLKNRSEIDQKYKWNIEEMYKNDADWERDIEEALTLTEYFAKYQGKLTESASTLAEALQEKDVIWQKLEKAYVFARMKLDEDNRVAKQQGMHDKMNTIIAKVAASMSFFTPELLSASEETLLSYIKEEPALSQYEFVIRDVLREKEHVLPAEQELSLIHISEPTRH